jgi:hypothetical protein
MADRYSAVERERDNPNGCVDMAMGFSGPSLESKWSPVERICQPTRGSLFGGVERSVKRSLTRKDAITTHDMTLSTVVNNAPELWNLKAYALERDTQ